MTAIGGSCLCGGVKFEITGPLSSPLNCHLFTMSQAAWRAVPQPRSGAGRRLPVAAGRAPDQILRERGRLPARVLPRMRLSDHQPDGTELEARRPVPPRIVSMRHPVGHSRRSTGPAGMPRLRRQQGAVVRDHRRSAAICGIRAAGLKPRQIGMRQAAGMDMQPAEFGAQRSESRPSGTFFACSRLSRQVALSGK